MLLGISDAIGGLADPASATVTYISNTGTSTGATVFTFSSVPLGTAGSKKIILGVCGEDDGTPNFRISIVKLDSVAMTEAVQADGQTVQVGLFIADASAATGEFEVTFDQAVDSCSVSVWRADNLQSNIPTDTATDFSTNSSAMDGDVDVQAGGIVVGISMSEADTMTVTWGSDLTEHYTASVGTEHTHSGASEAFATALTATVTPDWSNNFDTVVAVAAFR
jgi:hypothetical protein